MNIDQATGQIEFGSITVSPQSDANAIKSQYHEFILRTEGISSDEKIVLQNDVYWVRLNFDDGKLAQIDFTQVCDGEPTDDYDDVLESLTFLRQDYGDQPGAPYWEMLNFAGGGPQEPPIGGLSFRRVENPKLPNSFHLLSAIKNIWNKIFPPRSLFCCRFFQSLWENRAKHGFSVMVEEDDYQPLFWLQMRGLDSDKEEQYARIQKATHVDKSKLSKSDLTTSCELTLWTRTPIRYCPHCGKPLRWFYDRNWKTLFAPVPKHRMPGITKGE